MARIPYGPARQLLPVLLEQTRLGEQDVMQPIHTWNSALGRNPSAAGNPDQLVLLVRGELFRRYPNAVIYAAKATGPSPIPSSRLKNAIPCSAALHRRMSCSLASI